MRGTTLFRLGVAAAGVLVLGACTGKHPAATGSGSQQSGTLSSGVAAPSASGSQSVSASPTATPDQSKSGSPTATDVAGAEKALRDYFSAVNAAVAAGDDSSLHGLAALSCATCQQYLGTVKTLAAQHQKLKGGDLVIKAITADSGSTPGSVGFHVTAGTEAGEIVDANGKVVSTFKATSALTYRYRLKLQSGKWVITDGARISA